MNMPGKPDNQLVEELASRLLEVLIRAGLIAALVVLCYRIFSPFLTLMVWALILAVTMYPLHRSIAARVGGRQWLAATLLVIFGIVLIVAPTAVLMGYFGDSVHQLVRDIQTNSLQIPPPRQGIKEWPLVGEKIFGFWSQAHTDLPALVQSLQPKIGNLAKAAQVGS